MSRQPELRHENSDGCVLGDTVNQSSGEGLSSFSPRKRKYGHVTQESLQSEDPAPKVHQGWDANSKLHNAYWKYMGKWTNKQEPSENAHFPAPTYSQQAHNSTHDSTKRARWQPVSEKNRSQRLSQSEPHYEGVHPSSQTALFNYSVPGTLEHTQFTPSNVSSGRRDTPQPHTQLLYAQPGTQSYRLPHTQQYAQQHTPALYSLPQDNTPLQLTSPSLLLPQTPLYNTLTSQSIQTLQPPHTYTFSTADIKYMYARIAKFNQKARTRASEFTLYATIARHFNCNTDILRTWWEGMCDNNPRSTVFIRPVSGGAKQGVLSSHTLHPTNYTYYTTTDTTYYGTHLSQNNSLYIHSNTNTNVLHTVDNTITMDTHTDNTSYVFTTTQDFYLLQCSDAYQCSVQCSSADSRSVLYRELSAKLFSKGNTMCLYL